MVNNMHLSQSIAWRAGTWPARCPLRVNRVTLAASRTFPVCTQHRTCRRKQRSLKPTEQRSGWLLANSETKMSTRALFA